MPHTITHTLLEGNLLADGAPTREAVERLAHEIADAIAAELPGYEVEVPVLWRTSGAGPGTRTSDDEHETEIVERVEEIAGRAWERWCKGFRAKDMQPRARGPRAPRARRDTSGSILVQLTREEGERLRAAAAASGSGLGPWLRSLGLREAEGAPRSSPRRPRA